MKTTFKPNWLFLIDLFRNPKTRWLSLVAVAFYIISPIDLIPDFIPILGWLDDATLISAVIVIFNKISEFKKLKNPNQTKFDGNL